MFYVAFPFETIIILNKALKPAWFANVLRGLQNSVYLDPVTPTSVASLPSDAHRPSLPLFQLVRPQPTSVRLSACHPGVMPLSQPLRGPFDSEAARVCPIIWDPDTGMNC